MIRLDLSVNDIDQVRSEGYSRIRVYSATASRATDYTTLEGSAAMSANIQGYTFVDTDGSSSNWYKAAYYGTSVGEGSQAPSSGLQGTVVQPYYCTSVDVRRELTASRTDDAAASPANDQIIWDIIAAVSRFIDLDKRIEERGYIADASTSARYYDGSGTDRQTIDYCTSVDAVEVEETDGTFTTWTENTDYYVQPYNAAAIGEPYRWLDVVHKSGTTKSMFTHGQRRVRVAAYWGLASSTPPLIKQAAIALSVRVYKAATQAYQDLGAAGEFGQLILAQAQHPQIKMLLDAAFPHVKSGL